MDFTRKFSFLVFLLCVLISLKNQRADETSENFSDLEDQTSPIESLRYDYYNESCPLAEQMIRSTVRELHQSRPDIAPALLRLVFHDCFVKGCDASVLLDDGEGIESEKLALPNESLKGFDTIDIIKSEIEETCPGVVSCADILVLAARESVLLAGGPFYPLYTGRKDSMNASAVKANLEIPTPDDDHSITITRFASKGFAEREIVSLLGAHSTGTIHCKFFSNRLHNFGGTDGPDPTVDTKFLDILRSTCNRSHPSSAPSASPSFSPSPSSLVNSLQTASIQEPGMKMDYEGPGIAFGTLYYRGLQQRRGLLFVDQQLTAGEETNTWVKAYASDVSLFQRDFGLTMIKLSNLQVLTAPKGQVRLNCRKVN